VNISPKILLHLEIFLLQGFLYNHVTVIYLKRHLMTKWTEIAVGQFCVQPEIFERSITFYEYEKCKSLGSFSCIVFYNLEVKRRMFLKCIFNKYPECSMSKYL